MIARKRPNRRITIPPPRLTYAALFAIASVLSVPVWAVLTLLG